MARFFCSKKQLQNLGNSGFLSWISRKLCQVSQRAGRLQKGTTGYGIFQFRGDPSHFVHILLARCISMTHSNHQRTRLYWSCISQERGKLEIFSNQHFRLHTMFFLYSLCQQAKKPSKGPTNNLFLIILEKLRHNQQLFNKKHKRKEVPTS